MPMNIIYFVNVSTKKKKNSGTYYLVPVLYNYMKETT